MLPTVLMGVQGVGIDVGFLVGNGCLYCWWGERWGGGGEWWISRVNFVVDTCLRFYLRIF